MRWNNNQIPTFLLCLPDGISGFHIKCLCFIILSKDNSVSFFNRTAYSNRIFFQSRVKHTLNTCIEVVHIAM